MTARGIKPITWFWMLIGMQIIHSIEEAVFQLNEWAPIATGRIHEITGLFPVINVSSKSFVFINAGVVLVLVMVGLAIARQVTFGRTLAIVIAVIEVINGFFHIAASMLLWRYMPGAISGVGLIIVGVFTGRAFLNRTRARS
jgi:hypothetical protein